MAPCSRYRRGRTTSLCAARLRPHSRPRTSGERSCVPDRARMCVVPGVVMKIASLHALQSHVSDEAACLPTAGKAFQQC